MSKSKKNLRTLLSTQASLFDNDISEGILDLSMLFRDSLSQTLRRCRESRYQIAAKISEMTRHNISKDMLDKYTSSNQDYGLRAEDLPAFCKSVESLDPFRVLLGPIGCEVIDPGEAKLVRLARLEQENKRLQSEIAKVRSELGIK